MRQGFDILKIHLTQATITNTATAAVALAITKPNSALLFTYA